MYWVIDGLCFCSGLAFFIASFLYKFPYLCWVGLLWIAVYPLLLEVLSNLLTCLSSKVEYSLEQQSRIVYSPSYNITFCGIEKMHPFDSEKYGNIYKFLIERQVINATNVTRPDNIPRSLLLEKMSKFYLLKLCYTICICSYVEMPLYFLPAFLLRWRVLDPMMKAA
jgi:histone deacetylase 11